MKARVIQSTGSWYELLTENQEQLQGRLKGKFRTKGIKTTNPIAVGDWVLYIPEDNSENVIITDILSRKNYIIRRSVNLSKQVHIIASNIDLALLVVTINHPRTSQGFIDRFLLTAEAYNIPTTIIFNKYDLYNENEKKQLEEWEKMYQNAGYQTIITSIKDELNIDVIKSLMKDKTTVFSGHSGVGKSSLINVVDGSFNLKIGDISEVHMKGKHTTTFAKMLVLSFGGFIIDTPGIKGLGLVEIEKDKLSHYFKEMQQYLGECKFNNCIHLNEPKCAVREAVANEKINPKRYQSYLNLLQSDEGQGYRVDVYG